MRESGAGGARIDGVWTAVPIREQPPSGQNRYDRSALIHLLGMSLMQVATSPHQQLRARQMTPSHAWESRSPPQLCLPHQPSRLTHQVRGHSSVATAAHPVPHAVGYGATAATCGPSSSAPMRTLGAGVSAWGSTSTGVSSVLHRAGKYSGGQYVTGSGGGTTTSGVIMWALPPVGGRGEGGSGEASSALDPASFVSAVTAAAARLEKQQRQQQQGQQQGGRRQSPDGDLLSDVDVGFLDMAFAGSALGLKVWGKKCGAGGVGQEVWGRKCGYQSPRLICQAVKMLAF